MSEKKEFFANTLKDALLQASIDLGVAEEDLKYEIVTEKTRFFGRQKREICIRAWAVEEAALPALERFVKQLIDAMGLQLKSSVQEFDEHVMVHFTGRDYRLMLYQNGNLLNAVQYLLNRLFSAGVEKKIFCECENFRRQRERELTQLAHRFAREVKSAGQPLELKELNPFERRIVHMTINKYADLESVSNGDHFLKVITIRPK
ncbi:MAG: R3H domain-containing nucleic acid-binding protein [Acidobacteriota bacterium]|jgi:spoIIIJ-associated protein|nr:R3H domain-containing nucleic acid-binding protein [Acidobacteriota bacterium]